MPPRGPLGKATKHGRTPSMVETIEVVDEPYEGPWPDLPKPPGRRKWNELAVRWWETIKVMPHVARWDDAEWLFAVETFVMKDELFQSRGGDRGFKVTLATEIRHREAALGTTEDARRRLRIVYVPPAEFTSGQPEPELPVQVVEQRGQAAARPPGVSSLAERRERMMNKSKPA